VRERPVLEPTGPKIITDGGDIGGTTFTRPPVTRIERTGGINLHGVDGDAIPIVRPNPDYPARALTAGTEGWVQVQFAVTAVGGVRDAIVVDSEPGTVFDEAALKAVARWRYNPRIDRGVAVERVGLQAIIRFELEN
jgi:TonB family protein